MLLTLSVRTESKRNGNVRTFDPSCCAATLLNPASVLNQRAIVCSSADSAMSSRLPVKMRLPKFPIGNPALVGVDALELPAADDDVDGRVHVRARSAGRGRRESPRCR